MGDEAPNPFKPTLGQGLVLWALFMAESRNLVLPVLGHAVGNGMVLALVARPGLPGPLVRSPATVGILGLSALVGGVWLFRRTPRPVPRPSLTMGGP